MRLHYPALPHAPIRKPARESRIQLRVDWNQAPFASLAGYDSKGGMGRFQRQVSHFKVERLGHPQAGPPLLEHKELCLWVGGEVDDGVDLVGLKVLRKFPDALWSSSVLGLGIAARGACGGVQSRSSVAESSVKSILQALVRYVLAKRAEVDRFKEGLR